MSKQHRTQLALLPASPLLITESLDQFDQVRDAFDQELRPRGIIEQMYVADIAYLTWEILRLRRCKAGIINSAFRAALEKLLQELLRKPSQPTAFVEVDAGILAQAWFSDPAAKERVLELLSEFQLDESVIEAEAVRGSGDDLEQLDRLLASLELRRNKASRYITDYRGGFARQVRESSDRLIEGKVLPLENVSGKSAAA